jgi:sugar lactone lactonase YvrE
VTVTQAFPSSQTSAHQGSLISGVADVKFIGTTLYALTGGAGCSHGVANTVNGIYRVASNGSVTLVANLSAFQQSHPVAHPEPDDFEPDGTWFSMVPVGGALYAVEPNHGELDRITTSGAISRVADISATQGHIVPTAVTYHNGQFYVGNLNTFPITPGSSKILVVTPLGNVLKLAGGLTTVLGVTFDSRGRLYVLENSVNSGFPTPGNGMIVRLSGSKQEVIAKGLALPTAMTFGPDGALYVSNWGFGPPPSLPNGPGQVLRITVPN